MRLAVLLMVGILVFGAGAAEARPDPVDDAKECIERMTYTDPATPEGAVWLYVDAVLCTAGV